MKKIVVLLTIAAVAVLGCTPQNAPDTTTTPAPVSTPTPAPDLTPALAPVDPMPLPTVVEPVTEAVPAPATTEPAPAPEAAAGGQALGSLDEFEVNTGGSSASKRR
ncbi:MAG: hypothetical protein SGI88_08720 [Candidatus Hydrogenedentes bacterium]|nr:hypothetical protein [Candidatus Hydrogenedentota bacterium]